MKRLIINYILSLISALILFLAFYLSGAFANATFNVSNWTEPSRSAISFFSLISSIITYFITFSYLERWEEKN